MNALLARIESKRKVVQELKGAGPAKKYKTKAEIEAEEKKRKEEEDALKVFSPPPPNLIEDWFLIETNMLGQAQVSRAHYCRAQSWWTGRDGDILWTATDTQRRSH